MSIQIKSIFQEITESVFKMSDLAQAKIYINEFVGSRSINERDKKSILLAVSESKSMFKLQNYLCNALLKYEGMSLSTPVK